MFTKSALSLLIFLLIGSFGCNQQRKKVLYVNSYHQGYAPGDEIMRGIMDQLNPDRFELRTVFLDSKRNQSDTFTRSRVKEIHSLIKEFKPEIILVSDDNAVKYLVQPFLMNNVTPVVFCGVNWSADKYGLPVENITGMLEVLPLGESIDLVRTYYPAIKRIAILSENSLSEQNNKELLDTLYKNHQLIPEYFLVDDFAEWKNAFKNAMDKADIIYLPTNGSVKNWDSDEARHFVSENIRKPVFTCDEFMMDYCVFGLTKVAYEQGFWVGETAKRILNGVPPSSIPVTKNCQVKKWFNPKLAQKLEFTPNNEIFTAFNKVN